MANVRRIYVEKKKGFDVEATHLMKDLKDNLSISGLSEVRLVHRYDVEGITDEEYSAARNLIFSEPPVDYAYDEEYEYYVCEADLDEDEMYAFLKGTDFACPFYRYGDEYAVVRKQM